VTPDDRDEAGQCGYTLIEIVVTVWILGVVMVVMASGLVTVVRSSDLARRQTLAEVELRHYTEAVRAAAYYPCATAADYQARVVYAAPAASGVSASITAVHFWMKSSDSAPLPNLFTTSNDVAQMPSCAASGVDDGVQRLDLSVAVTGPPDVTLTTTIIKRNNGLEP
jgi:prepilin-type N-terminal cleavage/methylation domain-containing protein